CVLWLGGALAGGAEEEVAAAAAALERVGEAGNEIGARDPVGKADAAQASHEEEPGAVREAQIALRERLTRARIGARRHEAVRIHVHERARASIPGVDDPQAGF